MNWPLASLATITVASIVAVWPTAALGQLQSMKGKPGPLVQVSGPV
jgi:hypothetical protein